MDLHSSRSKGNARWLPVEIVAISGLFVSLVIVALLAKFHREIRESALQSLDIWLPQQLHQIASPGLTELMFALTKIGSPLEVSVMMLVALALVLARRHWGEAIGLVVSEIGALVLNQVEKSVFHRARPSFAWALQHESNFSFPSGHAMLGIVSFGTIAYLLMRHTTKRWQRIAILVLFPLLIFGIGLSRVYIGVHFPSDIIAGFIAGGVWLAAVIIGTEALHRIEPHASGDPEHATLEQVQLSAK